LEVENHHNFCFREEYGGETLYVHRKGATPAGLGVLGIIPGSMATPGFLVEGLGNEKSFRSASHGAGRAMSRKKAKESTRWSHIKGMLAERRVTIISASLDENPTAYKDISRVMEAQSDLVRIVGKFVPRIVKMAPEGEPAED
jgi:tRNA-splicing ligase RtcB